MIVCNNNRIFDRRPFKMVGRPGAIVTRVNCSTLNSSNQKRARVMTLTPHMLSRILSLPVEKEQDHFISAEV